MCCGEMEAGKKKKKRERVANSNNSKLLGCVHHPAARASVLGN